MEMTPTRTATLGVSAVALAAGVAVLLSPANVVKLPSPGFDLPKFLYPPGWTNCLVAIEQSTNLVNWTTIMSNMWLDGKQTTGPGRVLTNKSPMAFYRVVRQKGWNYGTH